jgi:hypothetical protein
MIQDMARAKDRVGRFQTEFETVLNEYELNDIEKEAFRSNDPMQLTSKAGVHPILAMQYFLFVARPDRREFMSLKNYPQLLED